MNTDEYSPVEIVRLWKYGNTKTRNDDVGTGNCRDKARLSRRSVHVSQNDLCCFHQALRGGGIKFLCQPATRKFDGVMATETPKEYERYSLGTPTVILSSTSEAYVLIANMSFRFRGTMSLRCCGFYTICDNRGANDISTFWRPCFPVEILILVTAPHCRFADDKRSVEKNPAGDDVGFDDTLTQ